MQKYLYCFSFFTLHTYELCINMNNVKCSRMLRLAKQFLSRIFFKCSNVGIKKIA